MVIQNLNFKIHFRYPEDKLACEHLCDTVVYECLRNCHSSDGCTRQCWLEHDTCTVNCPCNSECPDGCPEPYVGHPCSSWFCQGDVPKVCAAEDDPIRDPCPSIYKDDCIELGCCWTKYYGYDDAPWCHYPKFSLPSQ